MSADGDETQSRRMVWRLFFCMALINTTIVGQIAMAPLIGDTLAENRALATLPLAIQMTAVMAASIPAAVIFSRLGRRAGFAVGAVNSLLGSLTFALGVWHADFLI